MLSPCCHPTVKKCMYLKVHGNRIKAIISSMEMYEAGVARTKSDKDAKVRMYQ